MRLPLAILLLGLSALAGCHKARSQHWDKVIDLKPNRLDTWTLEAVPAERKVNVTVECRGEHEAYLVIGTLDEVRARIEKGQEPEAASYLAKLSTKGKHEHEALLGANKALSVLMRNIGEKPITVDLKIRTKEEK